MYKYTNISPEFGLQTHKTWIKKHPKLIPGNFSQEFIII